MTQDVLATHQPQNDIDERSTVTETDSSATEASEPERERPATRNILKRNAPTGGAEQGDSKRKDTKKNKTQSVTERVTFEGPSANASSLAASAAAILSSVPNSATNSQTDQSTNQHVLTSQQQFAEVLSAATSIANQMNSPIAVPSLNSIVGGGGTGIHPNIEEMLSHPAAVAAAAAAQANAQAQAQQNSLDAAQTAGTKRQLRNMSNDERRQRRLLRNRVAAKECRRKKKAYVADLEEKVTRLEDENIRLHKELEELNAKLTLGALRIEENNRLIKEVEELNAKLAMRTVAQQVQGDNLDQTIKTDS